MSDESKPGLPKVRGKSYDECTPEEQAALRAAFSFPGDDLDEGPTDDQ